jgi:hypothetical protein
MGKQLPIQGLLLLPIRKEIVGVFGTQRPLGPRHDADPDSGPRRAVRKLGLVLGHGLCQWDALVQALMKP